MNALEKYLDQKRITNEVVDGVRKSLGLDDNWSKDSRNDKAVIRWYSGYKGDYDINITMDMHYGWYGNSWSYSCNSGDMTNYMLRAMNMFSKQIAMKAKELAEKDLADAKEAAQDIAKGILADNVK